MSLDISQDIARLLVGETVRATSYTAGTLVGLITSYGLSNVMATDSVMAVTYIKLRLADGRKVQLGCATITHLSIIRDVQ